MDTFKVGDFVRFKDDNTWYADKFDIPYSFRVRDVKEYPQSIHSMVFADIQDRPFMGVYSHRLEHVETPSEPSPNGPIESDGGSTDYYKLPTHATELRHLISHKGMSKSRGDIFKACYRLGEKQGADILYDLKKIKFFAEDLIEMYERGERV